MWLLVLVLPWFVAIFWRAGDTFFAGFVGGDMLSKLAARRNPTARRRALSAAVLGDVLAGRAAAGMAAPRSGGRGASPARSSCWPG
jgi:hypothetical protein